MTPKEEINWIQRTYGVTKKEAEQIRLQDFIQQLSIRNRLARRNNAKI